MRNLHWIPQLSSVLNHQIWGCCCCSSCCTEKCHWEIEREREGERERDSWRRVVVGGKIWYQSTINASLCCFLVRSLTLFFSSPPPVALILPCFCMFLSSRMLVWFRFDCRAVSQLFPSFLQILDQGFILHPGAYMRDFWNIMDITVVSCALTSFYHTVA